MLQAFMCRRKALCTVFHLVSSEQEGQLSEGDHQLFQVFNAAARTRYVKGLRPLRYVAVLTKSDTLDDARRDRIRQVLRMNLKAAGQHADNEDIIACSSMSEDGEGEGITAVLNKLSDSAVAGWANLAEWEEERTMAPGVPPSTNNGA